jgi:hypothetical protein
MSHERIAGYYLGTMKNRSMLGASNAPPARGIGLEITIANEGANIEMDYLPKLLDIVPS